MPNNNDDRKLLLYISISIVLHLLVIYFLPIGFLHGSAQSESELNDYGYVQMVDYQPSPIETENAVEEAELTEDPDEEELEEIEEVEEPEKEPEIVEEEIEEIEAAEESEPKPEVIEEPEPASEPEPEVKKPEEEVIASEESESEVEVVQQEISESESESENEAVEENIDSAAVQEEESAPPPPPPTSGDLIGLIEPPTFPKDLVGSRSEGTVSLMVRISPGGNVEDIEIVESSGYDSMDRVAQLPLEHGWKFKEYQQAYKIPVSVRYYIDQSDNSQVEVDIGQVDFIAGGE